MSAFFDNFTIRKPGVFTDNKDVFIEAVRNGDWRPFNVNPYINEYRNINNVFKKYLKIIGGFNE